MRTEVLQRHYAAIGARLKVEGPYLGAPRIDVRADRRGELFVIDFAGVGEVGVPEVVDVDRAGHHLLLLVRDAREKSKFLCGHDERHWFVAAVPEDARGVTGVVTAKAALQPDLVRAAVARVQPKDGFRRRNLAYVRQGEWFFVPSPKLDPPPAHVLRDEPLTRGRGKAHVMERAFRTGGTLVYVTTAHPQGLTHEKFIALPDAKRQRHRWEQLMRDPEVYANGAIRHPDHATIRLDGWHRVAMNTEQRARAMRHVVFLD